MSPELILASTSEIRARMLRNAGLQFTTQSPRVDEDMVKSGLLAEGAPSRDIADKLAELKALKIAARHPDALVIGSDQVLEHAGRLFSKPASPEEARAQLAELSGSTHNLLSAAVICHEARPVWRHVGTAKLTMHRLSPGFIAEYVDRTWPSIQHSVGGYKIEEEGVRLFSHIEGDHFTIEGLPLLPLLSYLAQRGTLPL